MGYVTRQMREIREVKTSGRHEFSQLVGTNKKTLESLEQKGRAQKGELLEAVCSIWPKYTLWLMTGQLNEVAGQVGLEIEKARKTLKQAGMDTD